MKKLQQGYTAMELLVVVWLGLLAVAAGGWVWNIVKLVGMNMDHISGLLVVRAVGIFVPPLGAVVGFF